MAFKVGDIITFDKEKYDCFLDFMYNKKHIITRVGEGELWTRGIDIFYRDYCDYEELRTSNDKGQWRAIIKHEKVKRWSGSNLRFNFFAEDVDSVE